jgi:hypothetical protein
MFITAFANVMYVIYMLLRVVFGVGNTLQAVSVGPCHHGMARPHVADRGTASDVEGSCE